MSEFLRGAGFAILLGVGATAFIDAWALARTRFRGTALPDYGLVGRWLMTLARGRFRHGPVPSLPRAAGERAVGWIAHYLIGIAFASLLMAGWGVEWVRHPTIAPALLVGIGSVVAPLLILQPAMGVGIAAHRAPDPNAARLRSLVTHTLFGVGLYLAGWAVHWLAGSALLNAQG